MHVIYLFVNYTHDTGVIKESENVLKRNVNYSNKQKPNAMRCISFRDKLVDVNLYQDMPQPKPGIFLACVTDCFPNPASLIISLLPVAPLKLIECALETTQPSTVERNIKKHIHGYNCKIMLCKTCLFYFIPQIKQFGRIQ